MVHEIMPLSCILRPPPTPSPLPCSARPLPPFLPPCSASTKTTTSLAHKVTPKELFHRTVQNLELSENKKLLDSSRPQRKTKLPKKYNDFDISENQSK